MSFFKKSGLITKQVIEGITLKSVSGKKTMMTIFEFEPSSVIPSHKHPHEQITYIIEGKMELAAELIIKRLKEDEAQYNSLLKSIGITKPIPEEPV